MKKKIIIILLVLVSLSSILFINLGNKSTAQECNDCTPIPTPPGDSDYSKINCNCTGAIPTIKASASEITSGGSITLWVDSGGKACPDFTWSVSSAKYSLNKSKTNNDLETVTMTAASGTCSTTGYNNSNIYVTVTVTDSCRNTNQIEIRNTAGDWVLEDICTQNNGNKTEVTHIVKVIGSKKYELWGECCNPAICGSDKNCCTLFNLINGYCTYCTSQMIVPKLRSVKGVIETSNWTCP
jgi:hypothetical protein